MGMKSPCELLFGENKFPVTPKVFGCTCFVRDHRPTVSKLDPKAVKCIFIGYPPGQQGYKCWNPIDRRMFVSMDVTFRESEPFYGEKIDLSMLFEGLDHLSPTTDGRDGESIVRLATIAPHATNGQPPSLTVGSLPFLFQPLKWMMSAQLHNHEAKNNHFKCTVGGGVVRMLNRGRTIIQYIKNHKCKRKNNIHKVVHLVHRWMRTQVSRRVQ
jgi:hypothetical protein